MSTPVVVNRSPAHGTVGGVSESVRFGVRDKDAFIVRTSLQCFLGYGSAFWEGGVLPEDETKAVFTLKSRVGSPSNPALRSLDGDALLLEKLQGVNQEALYEFGGLNSPVGPGFPIMVEFELELTTPYTTDSNDWVGPVVDLKADDTGVAVKFIDDGTKKIEIHNVSPASVAPPSGTYSVVYDWDQGKSHLYKLLWYPSIDMVRLYVSSGPELTDSDILLVDGLVSDFPAIIGPEFLPPVQPTVAFGHGSVNAVSASRWHSVYIYHQVTRPIVDGIPQGDHTGFLVTDNVIDYRGGALLRKADSPWVILPDSFGTIGGVEEVELDTLILRRDDGAKSFGFHRLEPKVSEGITTFDVVLRARLNSRPPSLVTSETGMEIYVDDGVKAASMLLLSDITGQSLGVRGGVTIESFLTGWEGARLYRFEVDPNGDVQIISLQSADDGFAEVVLVSVAYTDLPASSLPGPGLGILHNANSVEALAEMFVTQLRYSLDVRLWRSTVLPTAVGWTKTGSQTPALVGDALSVIDDLTTEGIVYYFAEPTINGAGVFAEAIVAIDSFEVSGIVDRARSVTGVGFSLDDGVTHFPLLFTDGGSELGKIVFLGTQDDWDEQLIDIRAGRTVGTHAAVDWSLFHHYRIEKIQGGSISVYVDHATAPIIQFDDVGFSGQDTDSEAGIKFGSLLSDRKSTSQWRLIRHGRSFGYDVKTLPVQDDLRFEHAVNVIVEADS